jgi:hypothetical protein
MLAAVFEGRARVELKEVPKSRLARDDTYRIGLL